jgi:hypothetical protein
VVAIATLAFAWWDSRGFKKRSRPPEIRPHNFPPRPTYTGHVGAYKRGQEIEANWAGGWIPGTVIEPLGRGISYRVQLEDRRFPHPLVLSTNMLRPR